MTPSSARIEPWRPTREQIAAAAGRTVSDVIAPDLDVLFVGINPGLYSGAVGHHFARPGNRFWRVLHESGFTPRVLSPFEEHRLPEHGLGVTNLVERTTASAAELDDDELRTGGRAVLAKAKRYRPRFVAFLGISTYRVAFGIRDVRIGEQAADLGPSRVWVLPNPSGLNAHYQIPQLVEAYAELRREIRPDTHEEAAVPEGGGTAAGPGKRGGPRRKAGLGGDARGSRTANRRRRAARPG